LVDDAKKKDSGAPQPTVTLRSTIPPPESFTLDWDSAGLVSKVDEVLGAVERLNGSVGVIGRVLEKWWEREMARDEAAKKAAEARIAKIRREKDEEGEDDDDDEDEDDEVDSVESVKEVAEEVGKTPEEGGKETGEGGEEMAVDEPSAESSSTLR
jgi:hypothetical protein